MLALLLGLPTEEVKRGERLPDETLVTVPVPPTSARLRMVKVLPVPVAVAAALKMIVVELVREAMVVPPGILSPVMVLPTSPATKFAVAEVSVVVEFSTPSVKVWEVVPKVTGSTQYKVPSTSPAAM